MLILAAVPSLPSNVQPEYFGEASRLGLTLGIVIGGVVVGIVIIGIFLVAGWILIKYVGVRIGKTPNIENHEDLSMMQNRIICDPEKCVALMGIKQQQSRNVADIRGIAGEVHSLTDLFFKKLNFIQTQNAVILRAMVKNGQLDEVNIPKEVP